MTTKWSRQFETDELRRTTFMRIILMQVVDIEFLNNVFGLQIKPYSNGLVSK